MYQKCLGFAVVALIGLAACHNVFNKDKALAKNKGTGTSTENAAAAAVPVQNSDGGTAAPVAALTPEAKDSNLRYVYLTFDDGPDAGTMNCYNICKSKGVKATFFLVGEHANYPHGRAILDTMRKDLRHFLFANHSYTHASHNHYNTFYLHSEDALKDFMRSQDTLHIGVTIARFPGNPSWVMDNKIRSTQRTKSLSKLMDSVGYSVMGWDVEWHFDKHSRPVQTAEEMAKEVEDAFTTSWGSFQKNHVVLLAHDRMFREQNYKDSLSKMIGILQSKKGYIFETADQYPVLKKSDKTLLAVRK